MRFSWHFVADGVGRRQTAYQVQVAGTSPTLKVPAIVPGTVAGRRATARAVLSTRARRSTRTIATSGGPGFGMRLSGRALGAISLRSRRPSAASSGWDGCSWIGLGRDLSPFDPPSGAGPIDSVALAMKPAPYLRRAFTLISPVVSARLYVTALGIYRVSVNGVPAGDNVLAPGWTDYSKRLLYQTYDVTDLLVEGENVMGLSSQTGGPVVSSASTASIRAPTTHENPGSLPNSSSVRADQFSG